MFSKTNKIELSGDATISNEKKDKWKIEDKNEIYFVKKEEETINIYKCITKNDLKKFLEEENYEEVEKTLKAYFNTKEGYDSIKC